MSQFPVSDRKKAQLEARMRKLGVQDEDLDERFVRSSGPGGQHANKASTCVILTHRPTGLQVRSQSERSQALNRFLARQRLLDKLERRLLGLASTERQRIEKIRRQKRRRSRRARAKILADKRIHAAKKALRGTVRRKPEEE